MYDQSFIPDSDAFASANMMQHGLPMPETSFIVPRQQMMPSSKAMSMHLNPNGMNSSENQSNRVPEMIVTAAGLMKKPDQAHQYRPPLPNMGIPGSMQPFSPLHLSSQSATTHSHLSSQFGVPFPYGRLDPTRSGSTEVKNTVGSKNANNYEAGINDGDISTIVVSNDDSGEVKMAFTGSAVGQYETIGAGKSDSKEVSNSLEDSSKFLGICSFTALQMKGYPSSSRKSDRPIKMKSLWGGEDKHLIPGFSNVRKMECSPEEMLVKKEKATKGETDDNEGNGKGSKKNKLSVDDVYESGDGGESDGDISKDILKVRMSKCETCGKHFLDKTKLTTHKRSHSKPRSAAKFGHYPCEVCGYVFRRREHWRRHKLVHLDTTPYHCSICNRGFKRSEHVKRHQSVHTLEKPYECLECDKKFTRPEHLRKHTLTHSVDYNRLPKAPKPKSTNSHKKSKPS